MDRSVGGMSDKFYDEVMTRFGFADAFTDRQSAKVLVNLLFEGPGALVETAARLVETGSVFDVERNALSAVGNLVSAAVRRDLLFKELESTGWNLSHTAERLRLGNTSHVLRAIRELGLVDEYEQAKREGRGQRGGRRPRVEVSDPEDPSQ